MPDTRSGRERIARLEERSENTDEKVDQLIASVEHVANEVSLIRMKFEKSISFVGGIAFTFSLLGGLFVIVAQAGLKKMGFDL